MFHEGEKDNQAKVRAVYYTFQRVITPATAIYSVSAVNNNKKKSLYNKLIAYSICQLNSKKEVDTY